MKNKLLDYFGWPEALLLLAALGLLNTGLYKVLHGCREVTTIVTIVASLAIFVLYPRAGEYFKEKASPSTCTLSKFPPSFHLLLSPFPRLFILRMLLCQTVFLILSP